MKRSGTYEVREVDGDQGWYWRLKANNGEILCVSETYTREEDAKRGATDARKVSRFARIETL